MDGRLFEAAIEGNKEMLLKLLEEDPAILDRVIGDCRGKDNPLHVGALYGHVEFVREILNRKLELIRELNSGGQSPLHLASARGHVEVVKEILSKDTNACFIRDQDGMIPLHLAAIKGRLDVLETLVEAKITTAFILTESGEPILHLCGNKNQFDALEKLVELVPDDNFVGMKDSDDNTILHVLSAKGKNKLIRLLVEKGTVDVNAVNIHGSMPLDVSIEKLQGLQGWNTAYDLIEVGAKRSVPNFGIGQNWMSGSRFNEALLVVAVLMVTVAFQAGINPPGGVWQDTGYTYALQYSSPPKQVHHFAGQSIMSHVDPKRYKTFSFLNHLTLLFSIIFIVLLLKETFVKSQLYKSLAILSTFFAVCTMWAEFAVSLPYLSDVKSYSIFAVVFFSSLVFLVLITPPNFHVVYFETFRRRTT